MSEMLRQQGHRCFYCGEKLRIKKATRDHLVPRLEGKGRGAHMNIVPCCRHCNQLKAARMPTPEEIKKAQHLYAALGKPAFEIG